MFLVNGNEIGNSVSKLPCLRLGKGAFFSASFAEHIDSGME